MSDKEPRSYILRGEATEEMWGRLQRLAGQLGLELVAADKTTEESIENPTEIPYRLDGILSAKTNVSVEHANEFHQLYRSNRTPDQPCIPLHRAEFAFNHLVEPTHRSDIPATDAAATRPYAAQLGLDVHDRKEAGFPNSMYSNTVVTAGSFINVVRKIEVTPQAERPKHITKATLPFFSAMANYIEKQITGFEIPVTMDTDNSTAMPGNPA